MMIAWLECDVQCRAACAFARSAKCEHFRVRLARAVVIAFADDFAATHHDRADGWIRRSAADAAPRQFACAFEIQPVEGGHMRVLSSCDDDRLFDGRSCRAQCCRAIFKRCAGGDDVVEKHDASADKVRSAPSKPAGCS